VGNDGTLSRIEELKTTIAAGVIDLEIRKRSPATGMLVTDYRGKNDEQEIWKFDAALVARVNDVLKQAAIEEGQWTEKRETKGGVRMSEIMARLNAGRQRVAEEKARRDAAAALSRPPAS
jgi:hypothetical protein